MVDLESQSGPPPRSLGASQRRAMNVGAGVASGSGASSASDDDAAALDLDPASSCRLLRSPVFVLRHFGFQVWEWVSDATHIVAHEYRKTVVAFLGVAVVYLLAHAVESSAALDTVDAYLAYVVWWMGLGILSSVGLGTGLHSGMLFAFPQVCAICLAAERCGSTDFDSMSNAWFRETEMKCLSSPSTTPPTFAQVFAKCVPHMMLWGLGTAMGEIPPYAISYAAAKAGRSASDGDDEVSQELARLQMKNWSKLSLWDKSQSLMIHLIDKHGFLAVVALSSWPNAAFDVCGMCCGFYMMRFWDFFIGVAVGKACFKANLQGLGFTALFRTASREPLLKFFGSIPVVGAIAETKLRAELSSYLLPAAERRLQREAAEKAAALARAQATGLARYLPMPSLKGVWNLFVLGVILFFVMTCVEQVALMRARKKAKKQ